MKTSRMSQLMLWRVLELALPFSNALCGGERVVFYTSRVRSHGIWAVPWRTVTLGQGSLQETAIISGSPRVPPTSSM